jgi:hypothetical protein
MSRILKPALWAHMIVSFILGALLLITPGRLFTWVRWAPIDPLISRILGAALLAMSWGDWRVQRSGGQAEATLWVEVHLTFTALAAIGLLRHLVAGGFPVIVWVVFALFTVFALIWLAALVGERQ